MHFILTSFWEYKHLLSDFLFPVIGIFRKNYFSKKIGIVKINGVVSFGFLSVILIELYSPSSFRKEHWPSWYKRCKKRSISSIFAVVNLHAILNSTQLGPFCIVSMIVVNYSCKFSSRTCLSYDVSLISNAHVLWLLNISNLTPPKSRHPFCLCLE